MIELFTTFVRDHQPVVLGIIALGAIVLFIDREMTYLCPADENVMRKVDKNSYRCGKCGFVKRA